MNGPAETAARRLALHDALAHRNRIVRILRVGVPVIGLLVFAAFVLQLVIASLTSGFTLGKVTFSGGTMTVDTPSYSGSMANGDVYKLSAQAAQTSISNLNRIDMTNATLTLTRPNGRVMTARSAFASFETITQVITVPRLMEVADADGSTGTLQKVVINLTRQTLKASGPVVLKFAGGLTIESPSLDHDSKTGRSDFGKAQVTIADADDTAPETKP